MKTSSIMNSCRGSLSCLKLQSKAVVNHIISMSTPQYYNLNRLVALNECGLANTHSFNESTQMIIINIAIHKVLMDHIFRISLRNTGNILKHSETFVSEGFKMFPVFTLNISSSNTKIEI